MTVEKQRDESRRSKHESLRHERTQIFTDRKLGSLCQQGAQFFSSCRELTNAGTDYFIGYGHVDIADSAGDASM